MAHVDETTSKSLHNAALATLRQDEDGYERMKIVHEEGGISASAIQSNHRQADNVSVGATQVLRLDRKIILGRQLLVCVSFNHVDDIIT